MAFGILASGVYVPRRRLSRAAVKEALGWTRSAMSSRGTRAMAGWDEDTITMAVAAARDCLDGGDRSTIGSAYLASTNLPFADRSNVGVVTAALQIDPVSGSADVSGSLRAGTSAMIAGLNAAAAAGASDVLVVAAERRHLQPLSSLELIAGDGAAAMVLGNGDVVAEFVGKASRATDFVDHFRESGAEFDYGWEERWVRDEAYRGLIPKAIKAALSDIGIAPADIAHFILPSLDAKLPAAAAKMVGVRPEAVVDQADSWCGNLGAAHPLLLLAFALEHAEPGDLILVAGIGQGVDTLIFRMLRPSGRVRPDAAKQGLVETSYTRYLAFNQLIDLDWGKRAERNTPLALTGQYRNRDMLTALMGGECDRCGQRQFPSNRICVNPNCGAIDSQHPISFAERRASVKSIASDFLTYTPDPPAIYGMIAFDDGGQFMAEFTDCSPEEVPVGASLRMTFRIKEVDPRRNYRRYFWKAVPEREEQV
jgi:hydroxymethylglutaryl-CoA synthase